MSSATNANRTNTKSLDQFQLKLLNEFWEQYLATGEWPKIRVIHSRHQKAKTREALEPLGAHLVSEFEDHNQGNRYTLTATAALLTRHGDKYRRLLLAYLEFLRTLFQKEPEKLQVSSKEIAQALSLSQEQILLLGHLLSLRPFYDRGGTPSEWTVRSRPEVEDFPASGPLDNALQSIIEKDRGEHEFVFADKRRAAATQSTNHYFIDPSLPSLPPAVVPVDALKRRYQVFVSSTYEDLKDERRQVMQALLETKCIPIGMEFFPAASTEQWQLIQRVIDECDYYVIIVAGRYGSIGKAGISYTEQEFDYAVKIGKPVIGFYHRDLDALPGRKLQTGDEVRTKLAAFAKKVKDRLCRAWSTPEELGSAVKSAILNELEFNPRPGWIRADAVPTSEGVEKLKQRIADLEEKLKRTGESAQNRTTRLPDNGNKPVGIPVRAKFEVPSKSGKTWKEVAQSFTVQRTWDQLLLLFADRLKSRTEIQSLRKVLENDLEMDVKKMGASQGLADLAWEACSIDGEFFDRLIHTLVARKLVRIDLPRSTWGGAEMEIRLATAGIARVAELKAL